MAEATARMPGNQPEQSAANDDPAQQAERFAKVQAFGQAIGRLRDESVRARAASGIEQVWLKCEEAYLGIDDQNRAAFSNAKWAKPTTMAAPVTTYSGKTDPTRSTAFVRITTRYVDAGAAKIGEITDPVDEKPFKLDPTPVPDLIAGKDDKRVVNGPDGQPLMRQARPEDAPPPDPMGGETPPPPEAVPLTVAELARHHLEQATDAAKAAGTRIYDWLIEGKHAAEMRKLRFDMARLGTGVLKGPVPKRTKARAVIVNPDGTAAMQLQDKVVPVTKWVDVWNFFPSEDCGENIHDGGYCFERDFLSPSALRKLKGQPNYIDAAIDKVLVEGPDKAYITGANPGERNNDLQRKRFTVWYFTGEIQREDVALMNSELDAELPQGSKDPIFAVVTMVNDTAIKLVQNPLESGKLPYHVANWRRRAGSWAGVGLAEQMELPQAVVNGGTRALMNNGGLSAGAIIAINRNMLVPADGNWTLTPNKLFYTNEGDAEPVEDVNKAMALFQVPNVTAQMMQIIEYGFKLGEESTNLPLISQGQSGKTTPDTFGGQQLQDNNANQLLRDVGFGIADDITNPLTDMMYEWLLMDPDVPAEEKGDFQVNTNAAAAMIERAIQDIAIMQMGAMVINPVFEKSPKRWFDAMARMKRLDPREFDLTDEEKKAAAQNQQPPVPIAVAQIRAKSAAEVAAGHDQATVAKMKADTDRDTVYTNAETARTQAVHDAKMAELGSKERLAANEAVAAKDRQIDDLKASLAKTVMELNMQRELAGIDGKGPQVATPPTEPAGRAKNGEAYQA